MGSSGAVRAVVGSEGSSSENFKHCLAIKHSCEHSGSAQVRPVLLGSRAAVREAMGQSGQQCDHKGSN